MLHALMRRLHRDERGVAMMIAVALSAVSATLVVTSLAVAQHSSNANTRGRYWIQALDVAESGVEQAIAKEQSTSGAYSGTFTGSTDQGTYSVTVTKQARSTYLVDSTGTAHAGGQLASTRRVKVTLAPPESFKDALYAYTSIVTKNGDVITGDIWANQNVIIDNNTTVHGSATAATGYLTMGNGAVVDGSVVTGGFDASSHRAISATTIGGNATASVVNPPDPTTCGNATAAEYTIGGGTIGGFAKTWGSITSAVSGTKTQNVCTSAPAAISMPTFTYAAANYDPATLHEFGTPTIPSATAVADFQSYIAAHTTISGTFYVNQSAPVGENNRLDISGLTINGDTSIITNTPIYTNGNTDNTNDAVVLFASTYQPPTGSSCDVNHDNSECAIHLKNGFSVSGHTAVLTYAPYGPVAVKNNALQFGAIYADSMDIKNNQTMTYDSRVDRIVGFGPVTLDIVKWLEVKP
jgi:hypothetical protein